MKTFAQEKSSSAAKVTVITHVGVIDVTGSLVQPDMTVIISGNKIIALDKTGKISIPKNAIIINGKGNY